MRTFALAALLLGCDCGDPPAPDECHQIEITDYCGNKQYSCGEWDSPWAVSGNYQVYWIPECLGLATKWVQGPSGNVVCRERWDVGHSHD